MRYSSTTARMSRGGMLCKSNTSVMGIRIGSSSSACISPKKQKTRPRKRDRAGKLRNYRYCAHLTLSDLLGPVLAHNRFHLIFQAEFQFLQPHFLQQIGRAHV